MALSPPTKPAQLSAETAQMTAAGASDDAGEGIEQTFLRADHVPKA